EAGRILSRQTLYQPRHRRADDAADADPFSPRRGRAPASPGDKTPPGQRHRPRHPADDAWEDRKKISFECRIGEGEGDKSHLLLRSADTRLRQNESLRTPRPRKYSQTERVAQGVLQSQRPYLSGLFQQAG